MTNNELLHADMLDILFDGRNKEYGAYALRRDYEKRMRLSLVTSLFLVALLVLLTSFNRKNNLPVTKVIRGDSIVVITIANPYPKPIEVPKLKMIDPPPSIRSVPPLIVPDDQVPVTEVPNVDDLQGKVISTVTVDGKGDADKIISPLDGNTGDILVPVEKPGPVYQMLPSSSPEFPGGIDALRKFLARNLQTPEELEEGSTKTVRARFRVDKEGIVSLVEIETSAGAIYDQEVIRVCKKMPRWKPAIQNGEPVSMSYVLPVTFITQ